MEFNVKGYPKLAKNYCKLPRFLIILLYVMVVLQGIIYNSVFALRRPWVAEFYYLETIRHKTCDGYIEFFKVNLQMFFPNT